MKNTVIVIADLGIFKAYKLDRTPIKQTPRLELIEECEMVDAHGKILDKVTDQAGRWRIPGEKMAMSYGERQKLDLELRKRLIKQSARQIEDLVGGNGVDECYLAASKEMLHPLLEELTPQTRSRVTKSLPVNLTKNDRADVIAHFLGAPA